MPNKAELPKTTKTQNQSQQESKDKLSTKTNIELALYNRILVSMFMYMKKNLKAVKTPEQIEIERAAFYLEAMPCITANEGNQLLKERVIAAQSRNKAQKYHQTKDDIYLLYFFCTNNYQFDLFKFQIDCFYCQFLNGQEKKQRVPKKMTHKPHIIKVYNPNKLTIIGPIIAPKPQIPYEKLTTYLVFPFEAQTKHTFTSTQIEPKDMFMISEIIPNKNE